jgi:hypothetical protein
MSTLAICIRDREILVDEELWNSHRTVVVGRKQQTVTCVPSELLWSILPVNGNEYVACYGSNPKTILLHRLLTECPVGFVCDHRNHNGLDNRMSNLRVCTVAQNNTNRRRTNGKFGVVGVTQQGNAYISRCVLKGREYRLGRFQTIQEAVAARDEFVAKNNPEFGYLNIQCQEVSR